MTMSTKFVGESIASVKWVPLCNVVLDQASLAVSVSKGSGKRSVCIWECSPDKIRLIQSQALQATPTSLAFLSPKTFAVGSEKGQGEPNIEVWEIGSNSSELTSCSSLRTNNKLTTHVTANEKLLASVGEEGYLEVHLPSQANPVYSVKCEMSLHSASFYQSHSVLVGTSAGQLHNYDTRQGETPAATMSSDLVSILSIAVHTTQPSIVANARSDGSLLIWDMRSSAFPLATFAGHASAIWEVQFEKERSDNLYTCSEDGQLLLWNGAALSGVGGVLGGGGKVSPWLTPEISHQKMDVFNLLGSDNKLSINSFDVLRGRVICGGERQTLFCSESSDE